jgi:hypothetical protein
MRTSTYDQGFYAWTQAQAPALPSARPNRFDWEHIAEEVEALGGANAIRWTAASVSRNEAVELTGLSYPTLWKRSFPGSSREE